MNDRNKILFQILTVADAYDLEIIKINFTNVYNTMDKVEFTFKIEHDKFTINFLYEKDNMYEVNSVGSYIKYKLGDFLMGGK